MMVSLTCPQCKQQLVYAAYEYWCSRCLASYCENDGIPILLPPDEGESCRREREYWNARFVREGDVSRLRAMYGCADFFDDDWGLLDYMKRIIAGGRPASKVLEIGAGLGSQAIPLALLHGYSVAVTDVAVSSLTINREAVSSLAGASRIQYYVADAQYLPFADGEFDVVLLHAALHHLPAPERAIGEMVRCLGPGGLLVLGYEPNRWVFAPLRKVADRLRLTEKHTRQFVPGIYSVADDEAHGFFAYELRDWMAENGLCIEWMRPVWFVTAISYHIPAVTNLIFKKSVKVPKPVRRLGRLMDEKLFARIPGIRNLCFAWSLGARKNG